jgi:hypothetical protein
MEPIEAHAAREMVAGNKIHLSELIVSLRNFICNALDVSPRIGGLYRLGVLEVKVS